VGVSKKPGGGIKMEEVSPSFSSRLLSSSYSCLHLSAANNSRSAGIAKFGLPSSSSAKFSTSAANMFLQPGMDAPTFKSKAVVNNELSELDLEDYKGKYVVLLFYPEDFSWVCPTEILAYSERADELREAGAEVIGVSCDSANTHLAYVKTDQASGGIGPINYPLVADKNLQISRSYGVLLESEGVCFRGLFIIDGAGKIRQMTVNDFPVGRAVDETLRLIQAFKFTDEHGEVCPANWRPGKKSFKTDREEVIEYLKEGK